ncbi:interleukin-17F-like [Paroedura picta]|uniref:interleukin-17F-like n=1 Tax=Paroedura picta TaxID=143630 RepID=UPI004055E624
MMARRFPSLNKWLVLMLALMNSVHGKSLSSKKSKESPSEQQSDDCPTYEDSKFPDSVKIRIEVVHRNPGTVRPQDVRNRSLSPWDYRINEDPNRFPHAIAEANCRYDTCVDTTGGQGLYYGLNSVPIRQETLVLRRKQTGCQQSYWLVKEMVTVGCTCAFPATYSKTDLRRDRRNYRDLAGTNPGLRQ